MGLLTVVGLHHGMDITWAARMENSVAAGPMELLTAISPFVALVLAALPALSLRVERSGSAVDAAVRLQATMPRLLLLALSIAVCAAFAGYAVSENAIEAYIGRSQP